MLFRHDLVDHAPLQGLRGGDGLIGEGEFGGAPEPDQRRQQQRDRRIRHQADAGKTNREQGRFGCDAHVAGQRHAQTLPRPPGH